MSWLTHEIRSERSKLEQRLRSCLPFAFELELDGSFLAGLEAELRSDEDGSERVEVDFLCTVAPDVNVHDDSFCNLVRSAGHLNFDRSCVMWRWGRNHRAAFFSKEVGCRSGLTLLYQICVVSRPFFSLVPLWTTLFTEEEREWQRSVRHALSLSAQEPQAYDLLKSAQCAECRWRVCAAAVLTQQDSKKSASIDYPQLPQKFMDNELLLTMVNRFQSGESGVEGLSRPLSMLPHEAREILRSKRQELLTPPKEPAWIEKAELLQSCYMLSAINGSH